MEVVLDENVKTQEDTRALGIMPGDFVCFDPRTTITESGYETAIGIDIADHCAERINMRFHHEGVVWFLMSANLTEYAAQHKYFLHIKKQIAYSDILCYINNG